MVDIVKPDLTNIWASGGAIVSPSDVKIQTGWTAEVPPFQWENWAQNRQDQAISHINQHGIAIWDPKTEYQANKSYAQGSNGVVYKCLLTNINVNPVGDVSGSWRIAWLDSTSPTGPVVATAAQSRAQTDNTVFISPLQLANAFTGSRQQTTQNGYQYLPGGLIIQWGRSTDTLNSAPVTFPVPFTSTVFHVSNNTPAASASTNISIFNINSLTLTGFTAENIGTLTKGSPSLGGSVLAFCQWFAIGL